MKRGDRVLTDWGTGFVTRYYPSYWIEEMEVDIVRVRLDSGKLLEMYGVCAKVLP